LVWGEKTISIGDRRTRGETNSEKRYGRSGKKIESGRGKKKGGRKKGGKGGHQRGEEGQGVWVTFVEENLKKRRKTKVNGEKKKAKVDRQKPESKSWSQKKKKSVEKRIKQKDRPR